MRILLSILCIISLSACNNSTVKDNIVFADNVVVAHRGAWKQQNHPENSIAALKHAIKLQCRGSEFDVRMTADEVLVVNHDNGYYELSIEKSTYAELSNFKLPNGETLPTLREYLLAGMQNNNATGLVCEIKPSKIEGRNVIIAEHVMKLVKQLKAEPYILTYISFNYEILKKIQDIDNNAKTQYLHGSKAPEQLKKDGVTGLDYYIDIYKTHPEWIKSAKKKNLVLNAWGANTIEDIDWLLANNFNYITTDEPELVFSRIQKPNK